MCFVQLPTNVNTYRANHQLSKMTTAEPIIHTVASSERVHFLLSSQVCSTPISFHFFLVVRVLYTAIYRYVECIFSAPIDKSLFFCPDSMVITHELLLYLQNFLFLSLVLYFFFFHSISEFFIFFVWLCSCTDVSCSASHIRFQLHSNKNAKIWTIERNNQTEKNGCTAERAVAKLYSRLFSVDTSYSCVVILHFHIKIHLEHNTSSPLSKLVIYPWYPTLNISSLSLVCLHKSYRDTFYALYLVYLCNVQCELTFVSFHYFTFRSVARIHRKWCFFNFSVQH